MYIYFVPMGSLSPTPFYHLKKAQEKKHYCVYIHTDFCFVLVKKYREEIEKKNKTQTL